LVTVVAYLVAEQVRYPVGSAWTAPPQLVSMLFLLPTPFVPLIVAGCSVAGQLPRAFRGGLSRTRVPARVGDSFYSLGPAPRVLVLFGGQVFSWSNWPLLLLAFLAQIGFDAGAGLSRTWLGTKILPTSRSMATNSTARHWEARKEILNKPGELDAYEWRIIRSHTIQGERILKQVGGALARIGRYVRSSHEHYDGRGYPDGLAGESIPIRSRIVSVCDAYSSMTNDRPYRAAMPIDEALRQLHRCAGTQFDPRVIELVPVELRDGQRGPRLLNQSEAAAPAQGGGPEED
jgi:hypothetical protein